MKSENKSIWLHECSWPDISGYLEECDIVLLPVGATEQHGRHLPLFVDTGWAMAVAEGAAKATGILVAPPLHVAISHHHMAYSGTLTLRPETLAQVVVDIGESLIYHGFKKIIIVNGNRIANLPPLDTAASRLRHVSGAYVAVVDVSLIAKREVYKIFGDGLGHAGDCETSFMLHRYPEFVDMAEAKWKVSSHSDPSEKYNGLHARIEAPFDANSAFVWPTVEEFRSATETNDGVGGDPRPATRSKGESAVRSIVKNLADYIDSEVRAAKVSIKSKELPI